MAGSPDCERCMPPDKPLEYVGETEDRQFGIRIPARIIQQITDWCENNPSRETGGLLVRRYTEELRTAVVTEALPTPVDSQFGPTWFVRGIRGLNAKLQRRWKSGRGYYLGEWHYHPTGDATPSRVDNAQMRSISASKQYACPEPILLIVGGTSSAFEVRSYVFPTGHEFVRLYADGPVSCSP